MKRLMPFVELCEKLARKSPVRCAQHGACLVYRGHVISTAFNEYSSRIPIYSSRSRFQRVKEVRPGKLQRSKAYNLRI